MAETLKTRIIGLLSRDFDRLFSISDISKELEVAYSHAHTFIKHLAKEEIISTQKIGNALVCRVNMGNPQTLAHLALLSYKKTKEWQKKDVRAKKILERVNKIQDSIHSALLHNNKVILVVPESVSSRDFAIFKNRKVINRNELVRDKKHYLNCIILHGAEKFWSLLS